jgi:hypothetical protein
MLFRNPLISCPHYRTFLLRRQKKSTKRKGDFFSKAPPKKRGYTLVRNALLNSMALVFCLSLTSIELFKMVRLLFIKQSSYTTSTAKKGAIMSLSFVLLSANIST